MLPVNLLVKEPKRIQILVLIQVLRSLSPSHFLSFPVLCALEHFDYLSSSTSSCSVCIWLWQQHVWSSSQWAVSLHASTTATATAAGSPTQQRPAVQLILRLWISAQHFSEQFPFLTHLCCTAATKLLPGLQQYRRLPRCWSGFCSWCFWFLRSVTHPSPTIIYL